MGHPYHEILLSNKKERSPDTHKDLGESQGTYAEWKKPISKSYIHSPFT